MGGHFKEIGSDMVELTWLILTYVCVVCSLVIYCRVLPPPKNKHLHKK